VNSFVLGPAVINAHIPWGYSQPNLIRSHALRRVCLEVALAQPCTFSVATLPSSAAALRVSMAPGKSGDDNDNPLHFSGEMKDWTTFKEAIQSRADARDTTWLLEAGRGLALLFARQIKDKTVSGATRKKVLSARTSRRTVITYRPRWTRTPPLALLCSGSMTGTLASVPHPQAVKGREGQGSMGEGRRVPHQPHGLRHHVHAREHQRCHQAHTKIHQSSRHRRGKAWGLLKCL
jgi:hypothetical protein